MSLKSLLALGALAVATAAPAAPSAAAAGPRDLQSYSFGQYLSEFGKIYECPVERAKHEAVFAQKVARVRAHNEAYARGEASWFAAVNQFTDMTEAEVAKFKGHKKSRPSEHSAAALGELKFTDLPASVDWRAQNVVSPVKDQGGCGSCWAFSTVETVESHVAIKTGKLLVMSPQQIVSCASNPSKCGGTGGCEGATQEIGFNYTASAGGLSLDSEYPYWSGLGIDIPCNASLVKPVATVEGYVKLDANNATQLQAAIAQVGPIAISVAASGSFQMYGGGVLNDNGQCGWDVDHAVQAVGYGVDGATGFGYWLVRNSWNAGWGEGGYIRIFRATGGAAEQCGTDSTPSDGDGCPDGPSSINVCGECAVLSDSSYPYGGRLV